MLKYITILCKWRLCQ